TADLVDLVGKMLIGKDLPHHVTPPVRGAIADMPVQIAIDQGDGVEEVADLALAEKLIPVGRAPAAARHRQAELAADEGGERCGARAEDGFAKQRADAVPRAIAVGRAVRPTLIQRAEALTGHGLAVSRLLHGSLVRPIPITDAEFPPRSR